MSAAPSPAPAHDHDHFDGEPIRELPADEPRTPAWVPLLGAVLFASLGVAFLASRPASPQPDAPAKPALEAPAAAPQIQAQPAGTGAGDAFRHLTPEQIRDLQKRIEAMKKGQPGQPGQP